ncbi:hypothetical protein V1498_10500 [Peribacillus sp. SCS-26]|uniref:hypothetical protein n=1 Tax=Paraperibacillus marinus TaxID=3115295 RepID=UPI003905C3E8
MKKIGFLLGLVIAVGIAVYFVLAQPKLEAVLLGTGADTKSVVIKLGNKGIQDIRILNVRVNGEKKPELTKIQTVEAGKAFVISNNFTDKGYTFTDYEDVLIDAKSSINHSKYGLSVKHAGEIFSVVILYKYLGREFEHRNKKRGPFRFLSLFLIDFTIQNIGF